MAKTQNGYSALTRFSVLLKTIVMNGHSTKVRRGDTATLLFWIAKQLHYGVEPCISLYGWRDPALNDSVGGLKSSNHLSGTAIDYNGNKHPYEHTRPNGWKSGWTAKQSAQIADILRVARVIEWGNNLSLFPRGWRDPMHFAISRFASAAAIKAAAARLRGGTVTVTKDNTHGRANPNRNSKVLYTRKKGFKIKYVQVAYRDSLMWIKSNKGTWYLAASTTF